MPHLGARRLIRLDDAEGAEKLVQLGCVIEIARILVKQLPVGADRVALITGQHHRPGEHRRQALADRRAEIVLERRRLVGEGPEDDAGPARDPERLHLVLRPVEGRVVATDAAAALFPGYAGYPPRPVIAPVVVDAGEAAGVAARPAHHLGAAMGAAVDESPQRPTLVAHQHDRRRADIAGRIVAGFGEFDLKPEIVPVRPAKEPLILERVDFRVAEQVERYAAPAFRGPDQAAAVAAAVDPAGAGRRDRHRNASAALKTYPAATPPTARSSYAGVSLVCIAAAALRRSSEIIIPAFQVAT